MGLLLENPFRRRKAGRRRKASRRRSTRGRRRNPATVAAAPKRRRSRRRRSGGKRRSRGYRRNPASIGGAATGIVGALKAFVPALGTLYAGDALTAVAKTRIPFLRNMNANHVGIGVALLGGFLLKKFGGPLRKYAATFTASNLLWSVYNAIPYSMGGYGAAQRFGLAPILGASGSPMADYAIGNGDPAYGQIGQPALYDYVTANGYGG